MPEAKADISEAKAEKGVAEPEVAAPEPEVVNVPALNEPGQGGDQPTGPVIPDPDQGADPAVVPDSPTYDASDVSDNIDVFLTKAVTYLDGQVGQHLSKPDYETFKTNLKKVL